MVSGTAGDCEWGLREMNRSTHQKTETGCLTSFRFFFLSHTLFDWCLLSLQRELVMHTVPQNQHEYEDEAFDDDATDDQSQSDPQQQLDQAGVRARGGAPALSASPPPIARVVLRPYVGRVMLMGRCVDLSAVDTSDPALSPFRRSALRASSKRGCASRSWSRCCIGLLSFLCALLPSCVRHRPLGVRVCRVVRRLLWLSSWCVTLFLFETCVYSYTNLSVGSPATDHEQRCPAEAQGLYCYDNSNFRYVDCYGAGPAAADAGSPSSSPRPFLPAGVSELDCYGVLSPDSSTIASALATAAALMVLVLGGGTQMLCWALAIIRSRWVLRSMYLAPVLGLMLYQWWLWTSHQFSSIISFIIGVVALSTLFACVRIRLLCIDAQQCARLDRKAARAELGEEAAASAGKHIAVTERLDDAWADRVMHALWLGCCLGPSMTLRRSRRGAVAAR